MLKAENSSETIYYTKGFELISRRTGQDAQYYLFDGGMSVRGLTDETGAITDTFVFDAFGNEVARTGTTDNSYGFQGEEHDSTGLYYLRARYMDPSTATFTLMDTYAGSLSDPMSLHKYMFANSNPVKYCDPSGHMTMLDTMMVSGISNMLISATVFWFDYGVHPDKPIDDGDYMSMLICSFVAGFIGGGIGMLFAGVGLGTTMACALLLIAVIASCFGLAAKAMSSVLSEEDNSSALRALGLLFDVLGDVLLSPITNIFTFSSDLASLFFNLINELGETFV